MTTGSHQRYLEAPYVHQAALSAHLEDVVPSVCPPGPDVMCVCGWYYENHGLLIRHPFEPAPGEDTTCPDAYACPVCNQAACPTHDDSVDVCAPGQYMHHACHQTECSDPFCAGGRDPDER
jgi:hypothetical protein